MKTPREILLARHRAVEPGLDALRRAVIAAKFDNKVTKEQSLGFVDGLFRCLITPWRELILPSRRLWTGLAAVWMAILVFHISQRDMVSSVTGQPVRSPVVMMSWQLQQRWMNELLADRAAASDAERPRDAARPRSQIRERLAA